MLLSPTTGYIKSYVQWHDLRVDPEDLPLEEERVFVTVETLDGSRRILPEVWIHVDMENEDYYWCWDVVGDDEKVRSTMLWYRVVAWAYYPEPYYV